MLFVPHHQIFDDPTRRFQCPIQVWVHPPVDEEMGGSSFRRFLHQRNTHEPHQVEETMSRHIVVAEPVAFPFGTSNSTVSRPCVWYNVFCTNCFRQGRGLERRSAWNG